jgi:hypothetical protein
MLNTSGRTPIDTWKLFKTFTRRFRASDWQTAQQLCLNTAQYADTAWHAFRCAACTLISADRRYIVLLVRSRHWRIIWAFGAPDVYRAGN